jgi:hypothetical protein
MYCATEKSEDISIVKLKLLPTLHTQTISVVVCNEPWLKFNVTETKGWGIQALYAFSFWP